MKKTGEFEKRIETFLLNKHMLIYDSDKVKDAMINTLKEIVEDAREEFPELLYPTTVEYDGKTAWCNPIKAAKWFEKWFGEVEI